jgi:hypothetical protein
MEEKQSKPESKREEIKQNEEKQVKGKQNKAKKIYPIGYCKIRTSGIERKRKIRSEIKRNES